jgi:hypothetical protein
MEPVSESADNGSSWDSSKSAKGEELSSQFFSDFGADLTTFYNSTAASGDFLPYGVKAAWKGNDYTGTDWNDSINLGEGIQVTDDTWAVGAGISTYLLEGMGLYSDGTTNLDAKVQKFAIILDTGVAEIDNFDGTGDLNVGKFASSNYYDYGSEITSNLGGLSEALTDTNGDNYYTVSQVLSASFVDQNFDSELWNDDPFADGNSHGTHVAGTIAAKADGKGVVGVAPGAEIIAMKVLSDSGGGTFAGVMAGIAQAGDYILQDTYDIKDSAGNVLETIDTSMVTKENTVINMSLGGVGIMQSCLDLIDSYSDQGVVFSLAAGNDSLDVDGITPAAAGDSATAAIIPGGSANTWTVSAVDNKYNNAWFTNFDNDDDDGANDNSTVSAAGVSVYSYNQGDSGSGLGNLSGTSMAAPAVAGLLLMDPMDIVLGVSEITGAPVVYSSQWFGQDVNGDIDLDNELESIGSGTNNDFIGIQLGDDALPVGAAPYVDPFALTTLELLGDSSAGYTPEEPIEDSPEDGDGDEDDVPDESPWNGYDPTKSYYDTVGYVNGTNGTYVLSTGYGAANKSTLADTLGIVASDLDGSMKLTANDVANPGQESDGTKSAIYTTEGSGVKLTGFASVGETVGFEYVLSTNDYTPYSDFAFVQVKTGNDSTANYDVLELSTIGSVGLDLANFGTKVGYFEYTFSSGDFGVDSSDVEETEGYYDLSVGVIDAIDTWVDTTLMVKSLGEGGDASEATGTYNPYTFTWDDLGLGNAVATNTGGDVDEVVWNMNTGSNSVSQAVIEITLGGSEFVGELDTDLNGTKASINATEGSGAFATVKGKIGDFVEFDWFFDTNDYAPYKDFSFYTINGEAYKLGALGENVQDFGAADGQVSFELTEAMFDMDSYVAADNADDLDEGGNLLIGFGVMDALDWCVSSNLEISNLQYLDAESNDFSEPDGEYDGEDAVENLGSWNFEVFGNYYITDADAEAEALGGDNETFDLDDLSDALDLSANDATYIFDQAGADPGYELTLSTQWKSGSLELVDQATIEYLSDLDSGFLDTDLDNSKQAINASSGSVLTLDGVAKAGDVISFDWYFNSFDYIPFQDFAYFTINGKGDTIADVQYQPGSNSIDDNEQSGSYVYEITTSDLGGNLVGDVVISLGIVNALDNAVASELTIANFGFVESEYYDDTEGFDDSYDYFQMYSIGDVFGDMDEGFALSTGGDTASVSEIEDFISNPSGNNEYAPISLSNPMYFDEDPTLLKSAVNATEGSALAFCGEAEIGDILSFWYAFETNDYVPFADFSFYTLNDAKPVALGAIGDVNGNNSYGVVGNVDNWGWTEGVVEIELTEDILTYEGDSYYYDLTVGVVDALDTAVDSDLYIGGLELLSSGESSENDYSGVPDDNNGEEEDKSDYYDEYQPGDDSDDAIDGPQLLGNAFFVQEEDAVVLSTGGGAEDQSIVEDILGIKFGELDTTLNGSKEATNATEGSAAYATEQVSAGDVIQFSYTFGTNDYIPYQDFAFVSINGKVNNLATVGVECPDFDEISDVFNYVVTEDDLGGDSEGLVKIAVGIMDSTDTWVDSYIEIYDFSISDEELVDDASSSGIISGAGVYSINTSTFEDDFTGFSSATAKSVKINFDGDSLDEEESSYDIIASAKGTGSNANGYQILLEGLKDTKNEGKYNVFQTDGFGEVQTKGKLGWKSLSQVVNLGLEDLFDVDLDGDSILAASSSGTNANSLTLFSSTNGAVELTEKAFNEETKSIDQTSLDTSSLNIIAATPAKSDFNTFSTNASVYQVLIGGSGVNAGKYQKWQADSDGVIIDKNEVWKTSTEAANEGWELTFGTDFDGDGLISGDSIVKMLSDVGPKVLKNVKGSAIELSVDYGYDIVGSLADKNGNFDIVVQGNDGGLYEDQWAIWKANQTGKVSSEGAWISTSDLIDAGYEQQYDFDFTGDGFKGELDQSIGSDTDGLGVALSGGKFAMILSTDSDDVTTISNITFGKKNKNYAIKKNTSLVAAEALSGDLVFDDGDYAVVKNNKNNSIELLALDGNSKITSKSKIKNNSEKYLQLENAFQTDFNEDGIVALYDGTDFSGSSTIATNGADIDLNYIINSDGSFSTVLDWSGAASEDQPSGAISTSSSLLNAKGKALSLSGSWTFDSFAIESDTSDLLTFFTNKTGTKVKTFAFDWAGANGYVYDKAATKANKTVKAGSSDFFAKESALGIDFDGDGNNGTGSYIIYENDSNGALDKSTAGIFTADVGGDSEVTLTKKGKSYSDKGSYQITAVTDSDASDGTFEALMVNKKNNSMKLFTFNDDGSLQSSKGPVAKVGSALFFSGESIFELDVNGDGIIGLDANGDSTFDSSDTLAPIETQSATSLVFDIAGTGYASSNITDSLDEIVLGGKAKKGFNIIGVESFDTDGDGYFENYAMTSNKKGSKFLMYVLGEGSDSGAADWTQDSDLSSISTANKSIAKFNKSSVADVEYIFNQDFNGSTFIGT